MVQIVLSQIPNFRKLSCVSKIASAMSFTYSLIGIALSLAKILQGNGPFESTLAGFPDEDKIWNILSAIGDIAFAYSFSTNLINIQDTVKWSAQEKKVMKNAISIAITTTSKLYLLFALTGYAAFGNAVPGNLLAGFSSFKPFWIVDIANICLTINLFGGY
ncbi:amino acid permease 6-like [Apium graveolens]|uniref:amino acid permease 6-like n=1 Tax=Apium graveolens TaxID=4045 RepID=UPI003D7B681B